MKEMDLTVPVDQSAALHIPAEKVMRECFCLDGAGWAPDIHRAGPRCICPWFGLSFYMITSVEGQRRESIHGSLNAS